MTKENVLIKIYYKLKEIIKDFGTKVKGMDSKGKLIQRNSNDDQIIRKPDLLHIRIQCTKLPYKHYLIAPV